MPEHLNKHTLGPPRPALRVALGFTSIGVQHLDEIQQGIMAYARERGNWTLTVNPDVLDFSIRQFRGWDGHGIIVHITSTDEAKLATKLGLPMVNVSGALAESAVPRVTFDNRAVGRLAAEHLLARGFRRLAYYGVKEQWYSEQRGLGFRAAAEAAGAQHFALAACSSLRNDPAWLYGDTELDAWLRTLPLPVGLFAMTDPRAPMVLEACERVALRVPDDVAVVGTNNNQLVCEFCKPTLTSIDRNGAEVGYQAAALLDRLMAGQRPPSEDVLVAPARVVVRRSTQVVAVEDPVVVSAVRFIHDSIQARFGVKNLVRDLSISRRRVERGFRKTLGVTPHEYLCQARVDRAKQLLDQPKPPKLAEIALACGFRDVKHMNLVFHRLTGNRASHFFREYV
ncbi:MAG TPA: substrate-binding domain-containing protein [Gemmataceae bacterium]|nr:substrate-binding domain-containing protein [Gemmataceae bacterium]